MTDEKDTKATSAAKPNPPKKASAKKSAPKASGYVVAKGKAITVQHGIKGPGQAITADEVADIEALVKGGFVVKA